MHIKITSDSTCDLGQTLLEKHNITLARLAVMKGGKEFTDGVTIYPQDIFDHVAAGGELCSTAAFSIGQYQSFFGQFAKQYDAVIHVNISAEFSSCNQNALTAAGDFDNVYVVDSRNLSTGQGLVVLEAVKLRQQGLSAQEIVEKLRDFIPRVEASFVMNQLKYMVKGGRCSSATALGANLLNLKPCIEVKDGKMTVVKKYRGSYSKCLVAYVKDRLENREDLEYSTLFVTHTPVKDADLEAVKNAIPASPAFENVYYTEAGCTVSCHCGPETLGVLFVRK